MSSSEIPVVVYGVKSSPDEKESVKDQHRQVLAAIDKEGGRRLIAEPFGEANASGYRRERGPRLEAAMTAAIEAAAEHGEAELWVFHSSRLARGDGTKGKRSIGLLVHQLLYENVRVRSVSDDTFVTPMLAGIGSEQAHKFSADLSAHVRRGLNQRKASGKPVGFIPFGYKAEPLTDADGRPKLMRSGKVETERVVDPAAAEIVGRMFDLVEAGTKPGDVSRQLNAEGAQTARGGHWTTRGVRRVLTNVDYTGTTGYPVLIDAERFERIQAAMTRVDPAAVQARKGGRPAADDFLLAGGLAFCRKCGAPMRSRRYGNGTRVYRCRDTMEGIGLCDAKPVPAKVVERHVVEHLHVFIGSVEEWLTGKVHERSEEQHRRERALDTQRASLDELDRTRELHLAEYMRQVEKGSTVAHLALEMVERLDREREQLRQAIAEAEAVIAEWSAEPDTNAALDYYNAIVDVIDGKVRTAKGVREMNAALSSVIAGVWMNVEDGQLHASFELRPLPYDTGTNALAAILSEDLAGRRLLLSDRRPDEPSEIDATRDDLSLGGTEPHTFVYDQPNRRPISS